MLGNVSLAHSCPRGAAVLLVSTSDVRAGRDLPSRVCQVELGFSWFITTLAEKIPSPPRWFYAGRNLSYYCYQQASVGEKQSALVSQRPFCRTWSEPVTACGTGRTRTRQKPSRANQAQTESVLPKHNAPLG